MKKVILLSLAIVLMACGGVKRTQEALNSGNYAQAINKSIKNLADNKTRKGNQAYVLLLEEGFRKYLQQDGNPANLEVIFKKYQNLKSIQNRIRPLLPLPVYEENRDARFDFRNYDQDILAVKEDLSEFLYQNATELLSSASNKFDYRKAYQDFACI